MSSTVTFTDVPNDDSDINPETKYEVLGILGEGLFGRVAKCRNRTTKEIVALKLFKKGRQTSSSFTRELEILDCIKVLDPDIFNLVKFIEYFDFEERQSMAFEMLDMSVYDLLKEELTFSLSQIRPMAKQLLIALQGLQNVGVIHSDIKPDNIMLVNHKEQPFNVKLIDFGVAKCCDQVFTGQMMQPFSFRAPEVTLGLPLWEAVDVWSLACCLILWYQGGEVFQSYSNLDNLTKIVHFLGTPLTELLNEGLYTQKYFVPENNSWRLKTWQEYLKTTGTDFEMSEDPPLASNLEELIKGSKEFVSDEESSDRDAFLDLLSKMLEIDAKKRITPAEALLHPFITMKHLPKEDNYMKEAHELMRIAETPYGPLQRESLKEIVEKQKKEASAANYSFNNADESITGTDKMTESPSEPLVCQSEWSTGHFSANEDAASRPSGATEPASKVPTNKAHDGERKNQTQEEDSNRKKSHHIKAPKTRG